MLETVMITLMYISTSIMCLLGIFLIFSLLRPIKDNGVTKLLKFDTSNRVNRIWLLWLVLTRPWLFTAIYKFAQHDLKDLADMINEVDK